MATTTLRLRWLGDHQNILAALARHDGERTVDVAVWGKCETRPMEICDAEAPEFDGFWFESVPILQGKLM